MVLRVCVHVKFKPTCSYTEASYNLGNLGITVNSEIFARTLFSRNFAYAKFHENKPLAKWLNYSQTVVY